MLKSYEAIYSNGHVTWLNQPPVIKKEVPAIVTLFEKKSKLSKSKERPNIVGLFNKEANLMDKVVKLAMMARAKHALRET